MVIFNFMRLSYRIYEDLFYHTAKAVSEQSKDHKKKEERNVTSADSQPFLESQDDLSKWAPSNG